MCPSLANRSESVSRSITYADLCGEQYSGNLIYVDARSKTATRDGVSFDSALATITAALARAVAHDTIIVAPGDYDEAVTIAASLDNITIVGAGPKGSVSVAPSASNATALTCHGRDVSVHNVGFGGNGSGHGAVVTGRRFSAIGCKFEDADGTGNALVIGPGTVAQIAAVTHDKGDFGYFLDCEFAYATKGVLLQASDYGSSGQHRFVNCESYQCPTAHFEESDGTGGSAAVHYRDLRIIGHMFRPSEDGTAPTKYISLNDDNANTGLITGCHMPSAINSGKNLMSTACLYVGNFIPAGLSGAQPS